MLENDTSDIFGEKSSIYTEREEKNNLLSGGQFSFSTLFFAQRQWYSISSELQAGGDNFRRETKKCSIIFNKTSPDNLEMFEYLFESLDNILKF